MWLEDGMPLKRGPNFLCQGLLGTPEGQLLKVCCRRGQQCLLALRSMGHSQGVLSKRHPVGPVWGEGYDYLDARALEGEHAGYGQYLHQMGPR